MVGGAVSISPATVGAKASTVGESSLTAKGAQLVISQLQLMAESAPTEAAAGVAEAASQAPSQQQTSVSGAAIDVQTVAADKESASEDVQMQETTASQSSAPTQTPTMERGGVRESSDEYVGPPAWVRATVDLPSEQPQTTVSRAATVVPTVVAVGGSACKGARSHKACAACSSGWMQTSPSVREGVRKSTDQYVDLPTMSRITVDPTTERPLV